MSGKTPPAAQLTRYLLGLASSSERERLESEYLAHDDAFAEMLSAEDDLIDAYARGELSAEEHRCFEERFLNSASGRRRVQFARALAGFVADTRSSEKPVPYQPGFFSTLRLPRMEMRFAIVGLVALALATASLLVQQRRMGSELQALRVERDILNKKFDQLRQVADTERTRNAESTSQLEKLQQPLALNAEPQNRFGEIQQPVTRRAAPVPNTSAKSAIFSKTEIRPQQVTTDAIIGSEFRQKALAQSSIIFDLTPGTLRSEGSKANTLTIPNDAKLIAFRLHLENAGPEYYRAFIETIDGDPVRWFDQFKSLPLSGDYQTIQLPPVPASELPAGVYVLLLQGRQRDGSFLKVADYSFTSTRAQ